MLKIGLVGSGGMGAVHYDNYQRIPEAQVCGVCTVPGAEPDWKVPFYPSIRALCEEEKPDVLDICTPTYLHPAHVREALEQGVHVICEKPLALRAEDARELYDLAAEVGKQLIVAQVVRYFPAYQTLAGTILSGTYGALCDLHLHRLSARPQWSAGGWILDRERSGGIPFDLHIHDLDFLVSVLGAPTEAVCEAAPEGGEDTQLYRFRYRFAGKCGDVTACAEAAWFAGGYPWHAGYLACFEHAVMESDGEEVRIYPEEGEEKILRPGAGEAKETGINVPATDAYRLELEDFLRCIRQGLPGPVRPEEVLAVLETVEAWKL